MKKKVLAIVTAALIGTTAFAATASAASGTIDVISRGLNEKVTSTIHWHR